MGVKISKKQRQEILNKMIEKGKEISTEAKEQISDYYMDEVTKFYNEHSPRFYIRHPYSAIEESGMARTFEPFEKYEKMGKEHHFIGGINVNTDNMYDDYEDDPIDVLNSFVEGYHGPSKSRNPIRGNVRPVEHTREFVKNELSKNIAD